MTVSGGQSWQIVATAVTAAVRAIAQPARLRRLQGVLLALLCVWGLNSLAQLFWVIWPTPAPSPVSGSIVNPAVSASGSAAVRSVVRVDEALQLGLFGNPEVAVESEAVATVAAPAAGIEDGAQETRLALSLTGIVASSDDGLGSAVIAAKNVEATYAVGDALPVAGDVTLAKVMATQVVISNNGTYELLKLFEDSALSAQLPPPSPTVLPTTETPATPTVSRARESGVAVAPGAREVPVDTDRQAAVARQVRAQLYENPESLAQLVNVTAVRNEQGLRGYRVSPGQDAARFRALGLQAGDVITAVNGLPLSDPANTVRLYQMLRDATAASIDVERNGSTTSLSVDLDAPTGE